MRFFSKKYQKRIIDTNDLQRGWILWIISKTGYFGCTIRSVSLLRIRKEWIQSAVTRKKFNTHSSLRSSKRRKGLWIEKKGKREGIGKRGWGTPAIRTPFCSLLRTLASTNSCLAEPWWITYWRVSWRVLVRDKHDEGIKEMCSTGISFGRSKLLQSCSNLKLIPEMEPTAIALKNNPENRHVRPEWLETFQPPYASRKIK